MNGGGKKGPRAPGAENAKSLLRLAAGELTFHPKSITESVMIGPNNI